VIQRQRLALVEDRQVVMSVAGHADHIGHMIMFQVLPGEQRTDATTDGSTYLASVFNNAAINNARQCIFHHLEDASLIPSELPEPRSVEVSTDHPE
jgi:hypothetical protein